MGSYAVTLDEGQEVCLQYSLELTQAAQPPPACGPSQPPPLALTDQPQRLVAAELANRERDLASLAKPTLDVLAVVPDPATRETIIRSTTLPDGTPSPALQAYIRLQVGA